MVGEEAQVAVGEAIGQGAEEQAVKERMVVVAAVST